MTPTVPLGIDSKADGQQLSQAVLGSDPGYRHHHQGPNCFKTHPEETRRAHHCDLQSTEGKVKSGLHDCSNHFLIPPFFLLNANNQEC